MNSIKPWSRDLKKKCLSSFNHSLFEERNAHVRHSGSGSACFCRIDRKMPFPLISLTGQKSPALEVKMVWSDDKDKSATLLKLICALGNRSTIIFCNQREFVGQLSAFLKESGIVNVFSSGAMEQQERDRRTLQIPQWQLQCTGNNRSRGPRPRYTQYPLYHPLPAS